MVAQVFLSCKRNNTYGTLVPPILFEMAMNIPPSPHLLSTYNARIAKWAEEVVVAHKNGKDHGVPRWVKKWPRVHKIVGPIVTWMPMIMGNGIALGLMLVAYGQIAGYVLVALCFGVAVTSLPTIEHNEKNWCDIKYDWDTWEKDVASLMTVLNGFGLNTNVMQYAVDQILELRTQPLNSHHEYYIDHLFNELAQIADNYKKESDAYISNAIAAQESVTVSVQAPSILDNFGHGSETKNQPFGEQAV